MSRVRNYAAGVEGPAVLFVKAEWCPHCQDAKPEVRKAAQILGSVVPVYAVDSDAHKAAVKALKVSGFPTILFLHPSGKLNTFRGPRTGSAIADWACAQSGRCGR